MYIGVFEGESTTSGDEMLRRASALVGVLTPLLAHEELATAWRLVVQVHGIAGGITVQRRKRQ